MTTAPTTANPFATTKIKQLMTDYVVAHNRKEHQDTPHPGCAGCLLSGALETEVVGE